MKKAIILSLMLALVLTGCSFKVPQAAKVLTPDEAKAQITDYINNQLLADAPYKATINSISDISGVYKLSIGVNDQQIDAYMTRDASLFFTQIYDMKKKPAAASSTAANTPAETTQEVNTKTAKPTVELFVMSSCPYGTQIEKGILPVAATLGKKIDFAIKFCDYAMHGEKELKEEMNQYCIQQNEPAKFAAYLNCYLADGKTAADFETDLQKKGEAQSKSADILAKWAKVSADCVAKVKINKGKIATCVAATDKKFNVMSGFADQSSWINGQFPQFNIFKDDNTKYGVGGSPTLVINGETISTARDSASLLKTICSAFTTAPAECQAQLSSETPAPGFGTATAASGSDSASCNTPTAQ
ncbi:MAG: hypothetical protein PHE24_04650 [Patescibacteria group bacterium]|nr:hypothetical protein [Patescibacteria group bacterium]